MILTGGNDKEVQFKELIKEIHNCKHQEECKENGLLQPWKISDQFAGLHDCDNPDLWSAWQGNPDASIMILGQDWGNTALYGKCVKSESVCHETRGTTNNNLIKLLKLVDPEHPVNGVPSGKQGNFYFGNSVLCIRKGKMQGDAQQIWFNNCSEFLIKRLIIINPKIIIPLGEDTYRSILDACDLHNKNSGSPIKIKYNLTEDCDISPTSYDRYLDLVMKGPIELTFTDSSMGTTSKTYVFPVFHCGSHSEFNRGAAEYCREGRSPEERTQMYLRYKKDKKRELLLKQKPEQLQENDWKRIAEWMSKHP